MMSSKKANSRDMYKLKEIISKYKDVIYLFCSWMCSKKGHKAELSEEERELANEICESIFEEAFKKMRGYDNSDFKIWLLKIAVSKVRSEIYDGVEHDLSPMLNSSDKVIIALVQYLNLSYPEVGEILGISANEVRERMNKALGKIGKEL